MRSEEATRGRIALSVQDWQERQNLQRPILLYRCSCRYPYSACPREAVLAEKLKCVFVATGGVDLNGAMATPTSMLKTLGHFWLPCFFPTITKPRGLTGPSNPLGAATPRNAGGIMEGRFMGFLTVPTAFAMAFPSSSVSASCPP